VSGIFARKCNPGSAASASLAARPARSNRSSTERRETLGVPICGGAKRAIKKMFTPARFIDAVEYGGKGNKCARKLVAAFVPYSPYQL
jgi:hypothetical protein